MSQYNLSLYTSVDICKACNNNVLNLLKGKMYLLDSMNIECKMILTCDRDRDINDFRKYNNLNDSLLIVRNAGIEKVNQERSNSSEYFILRYNDSIILSTDNYYILINKILELPVIKNP